MRFLLYASCLALISAHAADSVVAIGKQKAASSSIEWDVRDVTHPLMGPIKVAVPRNPATTSVRKAVSARQRLATKKMRAQAQ